MFNTTIKAMRTGFEVIIAANQKPEFHLFHPEKDSFSQESLVTFARDSQTGIEAVLMGKIYYQNNLKARLSQEFRHDFPSDAALALAVFRKYGAQGLEWLEGEFSLAIFDSEKQCLFIMRDPLGSWPLYWTYDGKAIRVSTNLLLLAKQLPEASYNRDFLASFLMFPFACGELATEQTAFDGVKRLKPGNIIVLYVDGRVSPIWSWDWISRIPDLKNITNEEASLQFVEIFRQAVKERIQFGKIASHLSGGMDSSSVVCMARELLASGQLETLSLVYQIPSLAGEKDYIQMVVDRGDAVAPHYIDGDAALDFQWFTENIPVHDEPYAGLFHLAMEKALVDSAQQLGVNTVLSGGGAELIAEGKRHHLADLLRQGHWLAAVKEAGLWAQSSNVSFWSVLHQFALQPLLPPYLHEGFSTLMHRGYGQWPNLGKFSIAPWILPDFARTYNMRGKALDSLRQIYKYPVEQSLTFLSLQTASGNWSSWYLQAPLNMRTAKPFLDPRLITFCLGLPRELREVPGVRKPVLRAAMKGILPEPIRTRRFWPSFNEVYWTGLSRNLQHLEDMIYQSKIDALGIFDKQKLIKVMREHAVGIGDGVSGSRINSSLALIAWFDRVEVTSAKSFELTTNANSFAVSAI